MPNSLEDALCRFAETKADQDLVALRIAFLKAELLVQLFAQIKEVAPGRLDIPVVCVRVGAECVLPVFTNIIHLSQLMPDSRATLMSGRKILELAKGMKNVDAIWVNPADGPDGRIVRADFGQMLNGHEAAE